MAVMEVRQALNQAIDEEMERDENVFLLGEEVAEYNGAYKVSKGLLDKYGPKRILDTPIAESGFTGLAVGSAMMGLRPIVEYMSFNFSLVAIDQILSNAYKMHYMSGGQFNVPIVFRGTNGAAAQVSSQHSHCMESVYAHFPGAHVIAPSTPADYKGLLKSAIRCDDPVIFLENEMLYGFKGEVPDGEHIIPIGKGDIKRKGEDVTLIAHSRMVQIALKAAEELEREGISVEILDPRTIKPLDMDLIAESVKKTNRVVIVEEGHEFCGVGSEMAYQIQSKLFDYMDAPVIRVAQNENPLPYAKGLELASMPSVEKVVKAVKQSSYELH